MKAYNAEFEAEDTVSLDSTLHVLREEFEAARVATMQMLVFHMQQETDQFGKIPTEEFMEAAAALSRVDGSVREIHVRHLAALKVELPEELTVLVKRLTSDLGELIRIVERCQTSEDEGVTGFQAGPNFFDLCSSRVAHGLKELTAGVTAHFLELKEKEKSEDREKTNKIALEIGKIGRVINMVATNASIEAARVGDAGRGFTVIADEVKTLSTRVSSLSVSLTDRLT